MPAAKNLFRRYVPFEIRRALKKLNRRARSLRPGPALDLRTIENILRNRLLLQTGDTLLVHSSFGLLRARFTPEDLVRLLKEIVGPGGNLIMPFYPTGHSVSWLESGAVFDPRTASSAMGILTNVFASGDDIAFSPHPIKAVAVWGKDRHWLISEHHLSLTPYDRKSPYFKTLQLPGAKSVGLGIEVISFYHCCEDIQTPGVIEELYIEQVMAGRIKTGESSIIEVRTYCHDPEKVRKPGARCAVLKKTGCPGYRFFRHGRAPFYSVPHAEVYRHHARILGIRAAPLDGPL